MSATWRTACWLAAATLSGGFAATANERASITPNGVANACAASMQTEPARIATIVQRGEIGLVDGRLIRPLGVVVPQHLARRDLIARQAAIWQNREIALDQTSPLPDRWGRHASWASAQSIMAGLDALPLSLALLADGVGLADPSEVRAECRSMLLKAEADARRGRRGIWQDASLAVMNANNVGESAQRQAGQFSMMEGRVLRIGEGRQRVFINFGLRDSASASAAIPRRNMAMVLPSGVKLDDLKGKRLRLRGVVEMQSGRPFMLLEAPAMIEVLE
jgi:hypothetical protein